MQSIDNLIDLFRKNGYRITPQRRMILELLARDDSHPTADQVYQKIQPLMPEISRATIYNTIRELIDLGELTPVYDMHGTAQRYDTNTEVHHHLYCTQCHALIDIKHDFTGLDLTTAERSGFQIRSRQVTFYGLCPECQKSNADTP